MTRVFVFFFLIFVVFTLLYQLRIFRLGRYWPTFKILMLTLCNSVVALKDLVLLLFTFMFFSAVVGLNLYGSNYKQYVCNINEDCQLPHWHMHDFFHSFLNVFRILCGEWIETLWDCFKVAGQFSCIPFYMMVILIGKLLVSNPCFKTFLGNLMYCSLAFSSCRLMEARGLHPCCLMWRPLATCGH